MSVFSLVNYDLSINFCCLFLLTISQMIGSYHAQTTYPYFGPKTSYFRNAGLDHSPISVPGCEAEMLWFVGRHGARNPDRGWTGEMSSRLPVIQDSVVAAWMEGGGELGEEVIQKLVKWKFTPKMEEAMELTDSGRKEHEEMGGRWRKRLENLLGDRKTILVRASNKNRTRESSKFFLKGLFENDINEENSDTLTVPPSPQIENDILLNFYLNCPKYIKDVMNNIHNETAPEGYKLEQSDDYKLMLDEVRVKAGAHLSSSDILWIWQICGFEMSWHPTKSSPWCQLFTENNLKLLEFRADLTSYYQLSYAHDISWKITQPLFSDIFSRFEAVRQGKSNRTSVLYFGHSETVAPLLAGLGLYRDKRDLLASDWPNSGYKWRSSIISSFSANVGLVLLKCSAPSIQWKVMAMQQEKMVKLPVCEKEICTLDQFMEYYRDLERINFHKLCSINNN